MERNEHHRRWNVLFANHRILPERGFYMQARRNLGADGNDLDIFLRDYDDKVPSCELEDIKKFCQGKRGIRPQVAKAWLDDREWESGHSRTYRERLTAEQLRILLEQKVAVFPIGIEIHD